LHTRILAGFLFRERDHVHVVLLQVDVLGIEDAHVVSLDA